MKPTPAMCVIALLAVLGAAHATKQDFVFESKAMTTDPATGETRATDFSAQITPATTLRATEARFNPEGGIYADGFKLREAVLSNDRGLKLAVEDAVYVPSENALYSSRMKTVAKSPGIDYRCENGQLLDHGEPVPGNMTCSNDGRGHSVTTTCVGNRIRTVISPSPEDCPVPPPDEP